VPSSIARRDCRGYRRRGGVSLALLGSGIRLLVFVAPRLGEASFRPVEEEARGRVGDPGDGDGFARRDFAVGHGTRCGGEQGERIGLLPRREIEFHRPRAGFREKQARAELQERTIAGERTPDELVADRLRLAFTQHLGEHGGTIA
jgi:hypothetical protein